MAPEKPNENFPDNSWGVDIMFGEGGFGLGTFYRQQFNRDLTGFIDLSFSESKDDKEIEYIDYFGQTYVIGKKNRVFLIPITLGVQYRLFADDITDNLRPYINAGVGPSVVLTTPYEKEFFNAFGDTQSKIAVGGYVGFGANFGLSKNNLVGINMRYYYSVLPGAGVENLEGRTRKNIGAFYITLNLGMMY
ncbi:MAG: hypothetical protein SCALA702_20060 [Melioribacteraceae bacterium]|nr:MAG: hypothetical protein SCALA702_20060 [Melioribacteraceae bacterium]